MTSHISKSIRIALNDLSKTSASTSLIYRQGNSLYLNGQCTRLSSSENHFEFSVNDKYGDYLVKIDSAEDLITDCECKAGTICRHSAAALLQLHELIKLDEENLPPAGIQYTRSGMIKRVVDERKDKAFHARYSIQYADNVFGEHILTNERGISYKLTFRDIDRKHGYCSCPDYKTNKLGTCKHLIFAFDKFFKENKAEEISLPKYPFIEVFLNPFRDYKISWFYPEKILGEVAELFYRYFGNKKFIEDAEAENLLGFFNNLDRHKQILVRPEVYEKVEKISEINTLKRIEKEKKINYSSIKTKLLEFQKEGVEFSTFKKGSIIADELGLGNMLQAVAAAMAKKEIFGFSRTLIICPATLKMHWKKEIETASGESVKILEGNAGERAKSYTDGNEFFKIISYETLMRDKDIVGSFPVDLLILDEAQRIRNYASRTYSVIKSIPHKHALVLTGTPIETELIDLYSIVLFVDPDLLSPLWEFSYQHCYFDAQSTNSIVGYYNLGELKEKLSRVLIRRERQEVIKQLPNISQIVVPVKLSAYQKKLHIRYAREVLSLYNGKIISSFDMQKSLLLIRKMRMLTNSTFLVDDTTNISPKLDELKHILSYKLHIKKNLRKVVIYTEWDKMVNIISRMLRINKINFVEATEKMDATEQIKLFKNFAENEDCRIFLCTDKTAPNINLSIVDTVINMEPPQNNKQKNLRLGSIEALGKRQNNLTIINLIAENSVEAKMADGLQFEDDLVNRLLHPGQNDPVLELSGMMQTKYTSIISDTIEKMILSEESPETQTTSSTGQMKINFSDEEDSEFFSESNTPSVIEASHKKNPENAEELVHLDNREIEDVLKSGVSFLSQLFKISTGRLIQLHEDKLNFDPETGEITLKFRIPKPDH
ncbi:MAG: DEAD/DEAH box helicase [Bacteroidales bacterium]|nr:DEAD/DEAH box helicase [Bacteroidales bacterium]